MKRSEVFELIRQELDDVTEPFLWKDTELLAYLNWAVNNFAIKTNAFRDFTSSFCTISLNPYGNFTIAGTSGTVTSITVNAIEILGATVAFNTSLTITAADIAAQINTYASVPEYTATSSGAIVTISNNAGGHPIAFTGTGTLTATIVSGTYSLDSKIIKIIRAKIASEAQPLEIMSREYLDLTISDWERSVGTPLTLIPDIGTGTFTLYPKPKEAQTLNLIVDRLPLAPLSLTADEDITLSSIFLDHSELVHGVCHRAYIKQDAETIDLSKSKVHFDKWSMAVEEGKRRVLKARSTDKFVSPLGANI